MKHISGFLASYWIKSIKFTINTLDGIGPKTIKLVLN